MALQQTDIQRAFIVQVNFNNKHTDDSFNEFVTLINSANLNIADAIKVTRQVPNPQLLIGSGKADEIAVKAAESKADVVIFNHSLSPAQNRNLEHRINLRVIDRVGLILDIFAQRARSYEGKLQVELAQLQHLSTRLIRGWTHLERQKGGIGLRGPGETQLETDRRLIMQRIKIINRRLQKVRKQRVLSRQRRKKNTMPVVSLVGYTNAGKSTLFNYLTGANVKVADQLFATLDPTLRCIETATKKKIILTDTVGFIQALPHDLIESFQATLAQVRESDLLLHIIDVNQAQRNQRMADVNKVIDLIGASTLPQIEVYNKIDQHTAQTAQFIAAQNGQNDRIWLSSLTGEGVEQLLLMIDQHVSHNSRSHFLNLPVTAGQLRARLFDIGVVRHESLNALGGWTMEVELEPFKLNKLCEDACLDLSSLQS